MSDWVAWVQKSGMGWAWKVERPSGWYHNPDRGFPTVSRGNQGWAFTRKRAEKRACARIRLLGREAIPPKRYYVECCE